MDALTTRQSASLTWPREHSAAKQAYLIYLTLSPPRKLSKMAPYTPVDRNGVPGDRHYTLSTLERWRQRFKWEQRADAADQKALEGEEEAYVRWQLKEQLRRKKGRLAAAETQRIMAMDILIDKDTNRPRSMHDIEVKYLDVANTMLKESGAAERLDLGDATQRITVQGAGKDGKFEHEHKHLMAADPDTLSELRELVDKLPEKRIEDVIDITPTKRAIRDASRADEMSDAELLGDGSPDAPEDLYDAG